MDVVPSSTSLAGGSGQDSTGCRVAGPDQGILEMEAMQAVMDMVRSLGRRVERLQLAEAERDVK